MLLIFDALFLVFFRNPVCDLCRFLAVGAHHDDLNELGVPDFPDINHSPEPEVGLLLVGKSEFTLPTLFEPEGVDHRVEHFFSLNDFELGRQKPWVKTRTTLAVKNLQKRVVLLDLHRDRGCIFLRHEIGHDGRSQNNKKENQDDQREANADDSPIIEKVKLQFTAVVVVHEWRRVSG